MAGWSVREIVREKAENFGELPAFEKTAWLLWPLVIPIAVSIIITEMVELPKPAPESDPKSGDISEKRIWFLASAGSSGLTICFGIFLMLTLCCDCKNQTLQGLIMGVIFLSMLASIALLIKAALIWT